MTDDSDTSITFFLGDSGDVEWLHKAGIPDLTVEQAMVIVHACGMSRIGAALGDLAAAIVSLAERLGRKEE